MFTVIIFKFNFKNDITRLASILRDHDRGRERQRDTGQDWVQSELLGIRVRSASQARERNKERVRESKNNTI